MEAPRTSRPPLGICTRSRSQIPIQIQPHRTRSGRFINSLLTGFNSDRKRPRPTYSSDGDDLHSLIKDLRVKRVFSPTYKPPENLIADTKSRAGFCLAQPEFNPKETKSNPAEICGNRFDCSAPDLDDSKIKEPEKLGLGFLAQAPISTVDLGGGSGSDPDSTQTSPPEAKRNGVEIKIDSETKPVLKSRKRVFKAPGSFSYRRMLPYLKDINRDNSCMLDFCDLPNRGKGFKGKSSESKLVSGIRGTSVHHFTAQNVSRECPIVDSDTQPEAVRVSSHVLSNGDDSSSESSECDPESPPILVADQGLPKSHVDVQNVKTDLEVSCEVQKLNVSEPFCPSALENSRVNTVGVTVMCTDDSWKVENVGNACKDYIVSSSEDQNVKDINPQSSSVMEEKYSCKDNEGVEHKENTHQAQCEGIETIDMGYPCSAQSPNHINEQRIGSAEEVLNQICVLNEESIQMTPPDAEILDKLEVEVKVIGAAEYAHQSTDQGIGKPSSYKDAASLACVDRGNECSPKRKLVLNPCSRLKLFKSPGSVSYRRLLPFIMDMEKSASASITLKDPEQRQPLTPTQLGPPMDESNVLLSHTEPGTPTSQLRNGNGSSNIDGPNLPSPEHVTGSRMLFKVQKEMHGQHSASAKHSKLHTFPDIVGALGLESKLSVPIVGAKKSESPSVQNKARTSCPESPVTLALSLGTVDDCVSSKTSLNDCGKPVKANSRGHNSSGIDAKVSLITQADTIKKGILKRNPRGCRGLCTCLNCASFRLHAERSFEFSRNQMQDAEEVALNLMKELSTLRNLLERSAARGNDHVVALNEVNSACRKASESEDLARNRLKEMNYDLNIHCRITCLHEPRVRFANHSEEKVIPKAK
ncbi:uncharacterized protein LOC126792657 isoform X2 [Argentina anserina]|uniref:uncharacterized protein LOC126792657 isoform X2 n=1 Tax=Argentina anserina TaxID=57926 RepID=UPI0021768276|nr:uncharacterized protein LOC126792657 isoform X2 [Potentilla anserina]